MKKLVCPSCGANLELPENLAVAHCMYCGAKILLSDESANERLSLSRYVELLSVAAEAGNHEDMLRYANAILEIDPANALAWTQKGVATFWLTPPTKDERLRAAMTYLDHAKAQEPNNDYVLKAHNGLLRAQADWCKQQGEELASRASDLYASLARSPKKAQAACSDTYMAAMQYLLAASTFMPAETVYLKSIETLARTAPWIEWPDAVAKKRDSLLRLEQKTKALERLPDVRQELLEAEQELAELQSSQSKRGLFTGLRISFIMDRIGSARFTIARLEQAAAYEPPQQ